MNDKLRTWRSLGFLALSLAFWMNLWLQGTVRTRQFLLLILLTIGTLVGLSEWAERHSTSRVGRLLLASWGPRSETDGYAAAFQLLRFGIIAFAGLSVISYFLVTMSPSRAQTALLVLLPFFLFPAAMGLGGGLYLLVRTKLRR